MRTGRPTDERARCTVPVVFRVEVGGAVGQRKRQQSEPEPYPVRSQEVDERPGEIALLIDRQPMQQVTECYSEQ